jgi:hypothetical protein
MLSSWEGSAMKLAADHPDIFPTYRALLQWREHYPVFDRAWRRAREMQAEHFMQKVLDLANEADKSTAHAVRVKFDIYKFNASKILPALYGDKPSESTVNVSTQIVVGTEQLNVLRANLERARAQLEERSKHKEATKERKQLYPDSLKQFDTANPRNTKNRDSKLIDTVDKALLMVPEDSQVSTLLSPTSNGDQNP